MTKPSHLLVPAILASALLAAGCGGGDNNNGGGGGGGGGSSSSNPQVQQAVASCKSTVDQAQRISSSVKTDLKNLCEKAGSGNREEVRKAQREVCIKIIEENVPAGPTREQAKAACNRAGTP
jgi:hypothetical protein